MDEPDIAGIIQEKNKTLWLVNATANPITVPECITILELHK